MKIRIKGNSVRFRLTQTEVKQLCEEGSVKEQTNFGDTTFKYTVHMAGDVPQMQAEFKDQNIIVYLPKALGKDWFENGKVGFEQYQKINGDDLYLLLEKDFTCLDNTTEDQSDNYPNPKLETKPWK